MCEGVLSIPIEMVAIANYNCELGTTRWPTTRAHVKQSARLTLLSGGFARATLWLHCVTCVVLQHAIGRTHVCVCVSFCVSVSDSVRVSVGANVIGSVSVSVSVSFSVSVSAGVSVSVSVSFSSC